jgi:deazaflavin-dependent oxidoreductase (nitroreductase family)
MMRWANLLVTLLLRTPGAHRLISGSTLLLTVSGRRTGRRYVIPVVYLPTEASEEILLVTTDSRWARNLLGGAPVRVRLRGRDLPATATVSTEADQVRPVLAALVRAYPRRYGRAAGVPVGPGRSPDPPALDRAATERTLIRITLAPNSDPR